MPDSDIEPTGIISATGLIATLAAGYGLLAGAAIGVTVGQVPLVDAFLSSVGLETVAVVAAGLVVLAAVGLAAETSDALWLARRYVEADATREDTFVVTASTSDEYDVGDEIERSDE